MAGKPGMGRGNLNASVHPWTSFWRRRALKPENRWVLAVMSDYEEGLKSDHPEMSEGEKRIAELASTSRACLLLVLQECRAQGFVRQLHGGSWDLAPGAKEMVRFMSLERQALHSLGLKRTARKLPSLTDYMAAHVQKPAPDSVILPIASEGQA
jgi:hypothetical protein